MAHFINPNRSFPMFRRPLIDLGDFKLDPPITGPTTPSVPESSAKFDFAALKDVFLKEGLDALLTKLKELKASGVVDKITVKTEGSTGKTTVSVEVDGIEYEFTGVQGETPSDPPAEPETPATPPATPETPATPTTPNPPVDNKPTTPVNPAEALRDPIADVSDFIVSVCKDVMSSRDSFAVNYGINADGNIYFQPGSDTEKVFHTIFEKIKSALSRHAAEAYNKIGGQDVVRRIIQAAWIEASAGINSGVKTNTTDFINKVMANIDQMLEKAAKDDKYMEYFVNNCYQDKTLVDDLANIDDTKINTRSAIKYDDGKMHLDDDASDKKFQETMNQLLERLYNKYPDIDKDTIKQLFYKAQENALSFKDRPTGIKSQTSNMKDIVGLVLYHFDKIFMNVARRLTFEGRKAEAPVAEPKSSQTEERNNDIKAGAKGIMNDVLDVKDFIASNCKNKVNSQNIHTEFGIDANGQIVFQEKSTKMVFDEIFNTLKNRIERKSPDALKKLGGSEVLQQLVQAAWITAYNDFNSSQSNNVIDFVNKVMDNLEKMLDKLQTNPELMEVFTKHTSYADQTLTDGLKHYGTKTTYAGDEAILYSGTPTVHSDGTVHISATVDDKDYQATMSDLLGRLIKKYPSISQDVIKSVFTQAQVKALATLQSKTRDCPYGTGNNTFRVEDKTRNWGGWDDRRKDKDLIDIDQMVQMVLYYFDKLLYAELLK